DKWEYPWYASWDLAFHTVPLALVDSDFAKEQLILLLREWYMHPNGQLPAYEWSLGDVNPPVHAWAAWRVYKIEKKRRGHDDHAYEDVASKFWEHFLNIAHAIGGGRMQGGHALDLWDDEDGFFYDVLHTTDGQRRALKVRSLVGLIPMLAVETLEPSMLARHP